MNHKRTLIALAIIMMAVVPAGILMSGGSDASVSMDDSTIWGEGFSNTSDGTLYVVLNNNEPTDQVITLIVTENGNELKRGTFTVPADSKYTAELNFGLGSVGKHTITVTGEPSSMFPLRPDGTYNNKHTVDVTVSESLWSKPTVYVAIAVVVILIAIAVFLRIRNAPTTKPDVTFTELEKQQRESRGDIPEERGAPKASATEKRRYRGADEQPKKADEKSSAPPEEKKATTFTELEKQKNEKKENPPKKESSSEEPKRLKYVSSRRK